MANPTIMQKKNGKYLWFALLGLGFHADSAKSSVAAGKNNLIKYTNLGPDMFDKPNKDAFHKVTHFLLEKLNPSRFKEAYRYCWPVLNHKADAEFRKVTCAWLREIMDETAKSGSKVVASLFLSPGGPKFTSLMLHLASHVMLQEMKTFATDDSWVPEASVMPTSSLDMAVQRLNMITARFVKTAVDQDRFLHDYQRKAQLLAKSMRDIRSEGAKYDDLLKRYNSESTQEGASQAEKIKRVRSLWSVIDEMLAATKEGQHAVDSVLKGDVDQYTLDGTGRVLKIPRCLLERVEQLPHQLSSGKVYEAGQLNLLCVLELTNHALQLLKEERRLVAHASKPHLSPDLLQEKCQQMSRALQNIHLIRQKISKEGIPEVRGAIRELEAEWDRKWRDTLRGTPLVSFLNEDRALGFLSPMAPLSFEPATEASCRGSVFSQYPASLQAETPAQSKPQENVQPSTSNPNSSCPATAERTENPAVAAEASSQANTSLDWLFDTHLSPSLRAPSAPPPKASVRKTSHAHAKVSPMRTKTQILDMECDNLADQFADAVTTASLADCDATGVDLEGLLSTLHGDPFSTRKQLPRTPDSLIEDVKSSWRKALEEDEAERTETSIAVEDGVIGRLTSLDESDGVFKDCAAPSPSASCRRNAAATSHSSAPASQQGLFLRSARLWETINAEALDSPSGAGSSAVLFGLDHETLPEMSSCDSLLSVGDEVVETEDDGDGLLIPSLRSEATPSLQGSRSLDWIQQACNNGSFIESGKRAPEPSDRTVSGLDRDWPTEPAKSVEDTDKVFSLDLDTLKTPSPPKTREFSLPELITFSPIDDMNF